MQVYLVGGAVRDELLGLPVTERDWVVVGATTETMLKQGYQQVGKDFPVFLHPKTKEEYALARTERKSGRGYKGFVFDTSLHVTLEQDLMRRDLTINAIAKAPNGEFIDPYHGMADLKARVLRHVSPAFVEDPLRVLRVARFAAKFAKWGFKLAPETEVLLLKMSRDGELNELVRDRVWLEWEKALATELPHLFVAVLRQIGALKIIAPEIDALFGVPNPYLYHPEIDSGIHSLMVMQQAAMQTTDKATRFAALMHDLGKATTKINLWPKHHGHENKAEDAIQTFCKRYPVPRHYKELSLLGAKLHLTLATAHQLSPKGVLRLFERADAFRRPERLQQLLQVAKADTRGRLGYENTVFDCDAYLNDLLQATQSVNITALQTKGFQGLALGNAIHDARLNCIKIGMSKKK